VIGADGRLARLDELIEELAAEELDPACAPPQSEMLLGLLERKDRLDAEIVRRVGVWDRSGDWALEGAITPVSWLRSCARLDGGEATDLVRTARLARDHVPTGEALRSGAVRTRRVHQIAYAVKDRREAYHENPDLLLGPAATLPGDQFRTVMRNWKDVADDALARQEAFEQHERRHLHASVTLGGMVRVDGLLDPEGGEIFLAALETAEEPDTPDDVVEPRSPAQRRADALVALASASLGDQTAAGRPRVNLDAA
jgi:uncharacterized protein DUF222